jgi:type II secretory pathway component PulF
MPVFAYEGRTSGGEVRKGEVEAADPDAARSRLRQMQIQATSVKPKGGFGSTEIKIPMPAFLQPGSAPKTWSSSCASSPR